MTMGKAAKKKAKVKSVTLFKRLKPKDPSDLTFTGQILVENMNCKNCPSFMFVSQTVTVNT